MLRKLKLSVWFKMPILHWLTRDEDLGAAAHVSYRLLEEVSELSTGDSDTGNMLTQGDNGIYVGLDASFVADQDRRPYE